MTKNIKENISISEVESILDGIEKTPGMYGSTEMVEGMYWILLCLVVKDKLLLHKEFLVSAAVIKGHGTPESIGSLVDGDYSLLLRELKRIRAVIFAGVV